MSLPRWLKWLAGSVLAAVLLVTLLLASFGWNWLRGPLERLTLERTGRVLSIAGDLTLKFAWPMPRLRAGAVSFANPAWATEKQMVTVDAVEIELDLLQLLRQNVVLPEVRLERPLVFLERARDGRRNWLLDREQQDEGARIQIGRLTLDHGTLGYDDAAAGTRVRAAISTPDGGTGLVFSATGLYKGMALKAAGSGGPVLALRDETTPYALKVDAGIGRSHLRADGSITSLIKFAALDMQLVLSGDSLDQLYPLLGIAFPVTRAYATEGRLLHQGTIWRYEKFSGRVGASDIAGELQVDNAGKRPSLKAELVSKRLDLDDLGSMIGSQPAGGSAATAPSLATKAPTAARVLPDLPFKTERWNSVDAQVTWNAGMLRRAQALPLENLLLRANLRDSVLTLDPLNFGVAGGHLNAVITLDGRQQPIQAHAQLSIRKISLATLLPAVEAGQTSIGLLNGDFDLSGQGMSVGRMLAGASGKLGLVVVGGQISRLTMEKVGLHLWEILQLQLTGDRLIKLRCAVADFEVKDGTMRADALVFDTAITTILGTGSIDLAEEKLDLTLNQKTKSTSPLALRSPITIRGSFAQPVVAVDKGRAALRGLGALALGAVNPALALLPLIDPGPGQDSDCRQLIREARALPRAEKRR